MQALGVQIGDIGIRRQLAASLLLRPLLHLRDQARGPALAAGAFGGINPFQNATGDDSQPLT